MRTPIVAGNWKMNTTFDEAVALAQSAVAALVPYDGVERVLIPPFPWIVTLARAVEATGILIGAQNCAIEDQGAFTGEVAARMLAPFCDYIIVGHSERRQILGETDEVVAAKLQAVLRNDLRPILCVGETLEEREQGSAEQVVERQIRAALGDVAADVLPQVVVAYEPIWAIGTGRAATPDDARDMANAIRRVIADLASAEVADQVRVQYGGSVNVENAAGFLSLPEIDGALVGGASLKAESFAAIVAAAAGA